VELQNHWNARASVVFNANGITNTAQLTANEVDGCDSSSHLTLNVAVESKSTIFFPKGMPDLHERRFPAE